MKPIISSVGALVLAASFASPVFAGEVRIEMRDGRVTLDARNATVQEILAEWTKVTGARIVNAEKVMGQPVTLQLTDVPEMRALEVVLRPAAGFVAAPRSASNPGTSKYDRIMVLATSAPPMTAGAQYPQATGMSHSADAGVETFDPNAGVSRQSPYPPGYPGGVITQPQYVTQPGMMPTPYQTSPMGQVPGMVPAQPTGAFIGNPQQLPAGVYPGASQVPGTIVTPVVPGAPSVPPKPPGIPR